ncbi:Rieske 2Fe-2S domain-containing protein [Parapedobacter sp. SGR-10]|uniref:Rieske (2Fe-2S) protein n=1 Tax=Parapedobacter sp. SGR-10 TaxID=2710879 RepID=UPI0013D3310A|nr:Rieske 2Fe-2S domain-containing protein [Parapedobacter sp. SGR-10]NGF55628.1 Rieske 2Fe-2S domain-containing protein [Parapedobacter sp. SGR-10]
MDKLIWYAIQVPEGEGKVHRIIVDGKKLCVVVQNGKPYATSSRCPHAGADLSQGWCEEGRLVCPYHRHRFDLQTGRGDPGQGDYIHVYPMKKENGQWYVGLERPWWRRIFG